MKKVAQIFFACLALAGIFSCQLFELPVSSKSTALIYGVSNYVSFNDLVGPTNDVSAMTSTLEDHGWTAQPRLNSSATSTQLASDLSLLATDAKAFDKVLFYFSGHGLDPAPSFGTTEESIVMYDTSYTNLAGFMTPSRLKVLIAPLLEANVMVIIIIDTCYSGGFVADGAYANLLPYNYSETEDFYVSGNGGGAFAQSLSRYFGPATKQTDTQGHGFAAANLWVLSAAGPNEESWESSIGSGPSQGIFSYFLGQAALHGDSNNDGLVSIYEAYRYAKGGLEARWNTQYSGNTYEDYQYLPHIYGNPYDLSLFTL